MHAHKPSSPESAADAMAGHAGDAARLLKALANDRRLMILCLLVDGPLTVGEINQRVALSQSALSQHLALLRADGLVVAERVAQTVRYSLHSGPARRIIDALHGIYCTPSGATKESR